MKCTLCDTPLSKKVDEYYFICSTCGAYVMDRKHYIAPLSEKSRYEEHNNDVNNVRYQKFVLPITEEILKNFKPQHKGLDYGSGTGPVITKMLKDKGYNVKMYDPYFHPDESYLNQEYDYIFSCEVFEHFHQPKQEIEKLLNLLKPNGLLLIKTHLYNRKINFKNWYYRQDETHVFIYTAKTMKYIEEKFNLNIIKQDNRIIVMQKSGKNKLNKI